METGFRAGFVVPWSQTEINGLEAAPVQCIEVGAAWSWFGRALPLDGMAGPAVAQRSESAQGFRRLLAQHVERHLRANLEPDLRHAPMAQEPLVDSSVVLTNGSCTYTATLIFVEQGVQPFLMFVNDMPPRDTELWVVDHTLGAQHHNDTGPDGSGVICFTPGTRLATPRGRVAIETLKLGDLVLTKDNGPQPIEWIGQRRMTGARLFAMPHLRPVRLSAGALGIDRPDAALLVSPNHRVLVSGARASALFNTPEVLVAAKDLIDGHHVRTATSPGTTTYIHLLLPQHNVVWANGVAIESFHPANTSLASLEQSDRARLIARYPALSFDPHTYGGYARRNLCAAEAEVLSRAA